MSIYSSKEYFSLLDYSISHGILLIRSTEIKKTHHINTDICFSATFYIEFPTELKGLTIELGTAKDCEYLKNVLPKSNTDPMHVGSVYIIISEGKRYFIGARAISITQNSYHPLETSIGFKRRA
jgi:hypothetical protein